MEGFIFLTVLVVIVFGVRAIFAAKKAAADFDALAKRKVKEFEDNNKDAPRPG